MKKVLLSGNCNFDYPYIKKIIESHFDSEVIRAHDNEDARKLINKNKYDLVMVNRIGAFDNKPGIEIIKYMQSDSELKKTPVMLITNYPMYMKEAIEAGAVEGFGKENVKSEATLDILRKYLG